MLLQKHYSKSKGLTLAPCERVTKRLMVFLLTVFFLLDWSQKHQGEEADTPASTSGWDPSSRSSRGRGGSTKLSQKTTKYLHSTILWRDCTSLIGDKLLVSYFPIHPLRNQLFTVWKSHRTIELCGLLFTIECYRNWTLWRFMETYMATKLKGCLD